MSNPTLDITAPDGATARLSLNGGHLLSWCPAGAGEQLYLSPQSGFAPGQAIRGGVPVIFPQFSDRGELPRHGFARTARWTLVSQEQGKDDAMAVLRLSDDAATRAIWPAAFELELSVRVTGPTLDIELACLNRGDEGLSFTAALHTYLAVNDLDATSLAGLSGLRYWDSVLQREERQRVELLLPGEGGVLDLDRIYFGATQELLLTEQALSGKTRRLLIRQQGFEDVVTWNPGPERCAKLADMPADGWQKMLCVEAAVIGHPVQLAAGEEWVGRQSLTLL